jgi:FdhD protein
MHVRRANSQHGNEPGIAQVRVVAIPLGDTDTAREDAVAVEEPLEVRIGGKPITVLMRTPGHDEELITGFLFGEGVISDPDDIISFEVASANVLEVRLMLARQLPGDRLFFSNSSCGICGKQSLASIEVRGSPIDSKLTVPQHILSELTERLRAAQPLFARTGGTHASGLFTSTGELLVVREDVGRHNALDKLIGWALAEGRIPLSDSLLLVSGRLSYELVQKAVVAGIPLVAAVGAPSSFAVELAERFHITLVGFLRATGMNVYTHPARITN